MNRKPKLDELPVKTGIAFLDAVKLACQQVRSPRPDTSEKSQITDETLSDAYAAVWEAKDIPVEVASWICSTIKTSIETSQRRQRRYTARFRSTSNADNPDEKVHSTPILPNIDVLQQSHRSSSKTPSSIDEHRIDLAEWIERLANDEFERQALLSAAGFHHKYRSLADFTKHQEFCSAAKAYRKRAQMIDRLGVSFREFQKAG